MAEYPNLAGTYTTEFFDKDVGYTETHFTFAQDGAQVTLTAVCLENGKMVSSQRDEGRIVRVHSGEVVQIEFNPGRFVFLDVRAGKLVDNPEFFTD